MPQSFNDFIAVLRSVLTREEFRGAVVYAIEKPIPKGTRLQFPGVKIDVTANSYLAFVDRQPMANWGHSARYILAGEKNETISYETRFPPFNQTDKLNWCVVYKAAIVPAAAVGRFKMSSLIISAN